MLFLYFARAGNHKNITITETSAYYDGLYIVDNQPFRRKRTDSEPEYREYETYRIRQKKQKYDKKHRFRNNRTLS